MSRKPPTLIEVVTDCLKSGFEIKLHKELNQYFVEVSKWTLGKRTAVIPEDHLYKLEQYIEYCKDQLIRGKPDNEDEL